MPNFEAALAQLEKSKDNSGLPNWEMLSQLQNSKDKQIPGVLPNFDILLQQQLSQSGKEGGGKAGGLLNWEALAQLQLQGQNSKDSLKNLTSGMPNLDLLLQLQLSKDSGAGKNFPGWDALSLAQMQLAQSQLGKDNQTKHGSGLPNFDMLAQLQSFKDKTKGPHGLPNFEALALAQLQLSQGMKDSKSLSNIPNFDSQLKDSYSKMGLSAIPNFEALMQLQMGKTSKDQSKNLEALAQLTSKEGGKPPGGAFEPGKEKIPGFEALAQLQLAAKDGKSPFPGLNFEALSQFQAQSQKDCGKTGLPPFPNFEALALAQLQLSQCGKDKGSFGGVPNFEALAKFQMGQNSKEGLKGLTPSYEFLQQAGQTPKDLPAKGNDWDGDSKDKK